MRVARHADHLARAIAALQREAALKLALRDDTGGDVRTRVAVELQAPPARHAAAVLAARKLLEARGPPVLAAAVALARIEAEAWQQGLVALRLRHWRVAAPTEQEG